MLVALADIGEEGPASRPEDLFAYAELLGEQADVLSARDPLPSQKTVGAAHQRHAPASWATAWSKSLAGRRPSVPTSPRT